MAGSGERLFKSHRQSVPLPLVLACPKHIWAWPLGWRNICQLCWFIILRGSLIILKCSHVLEWIVFESFTSS